MTTESEGMVPGLSAYADELERRATEQNEWEKHPKCEEHGVGDVMQVIANELRAMLAAAFRPPSLPEGMVPSEEAKDFAADYAELDGIKLPSVHRDALVCMAKEILRLTKGGKS